MKSLLFKATLFVAVLGAISPVQAQVGTPKYHFKSRAEVEAATRKNFLNLRESYNIILCAKRQGMIKSVVRVYEQQAGGNPFNTPPEISSSFALAHHLLSEPVWWDYPVDRAQGLTNLSQVDGLRIMLFRDRALKALPNSPEVLLGYAIWAKDQRQREKALNLVQKALRYAPDWADLHRWHATMIGARLSSLSPAEREKQRVRYGNLELRALDRAEQLDPYFKRENYSSRAYAYNNAKRYREALAAFDTYNRLRPDYRRYLGAERYQQTRNAYLDAIKKAG